MDFDSLLEGRFGPEYHAAELKAFKHGVETGQVQIAGDPKLSKDAARMPAHAGEDPFYAGPIVRAEQPAAPNTQANGVMHFTVRRPF